MIIECFGSSVIGERDSNQDSIACHRSYDGSAAIIAVADGMGGYQGGDIASALAIEAVESTPLELLRAAGGDRQSPDEVLLAAARQANDAICRKRIAEPKLAKMGTTLTAAMLRDGSLYLVHIGDSRCYRLRQGELEQLTVDHNLAQQLVAEKALAAGDVASHPYSNILTRALGTDAEADICHQQLETRVGDSYLICSDGVTGVLGDDDIADTMGRNPAPEAAVEALLKQCTDRKTRDNASLVIARISD